jgi:hypothetical protein
VNRHSLSLSAVPSALLLLLGSRLASAASPPSLDYRAPAGCPDSASFVAAVESRGASFAASRASRLLVEIASEEGGFAGSVQLQSEGEASGPRRVHAASCAEVSDALAVVTAIALQREAASGTPTPVAPAAPAPRPPAPVAAHPHVSPVELVMSRKDIEVGPGKLVLDYISTHTLSAGAQFGAIPGLVLPRLDYTWSRANMVTAPDGRAFMLGNEYRVRWTMLGPIHHRAPGYETELFGVKAGIGGCTPVWFDPQGLTLKLCSEMAVGMMGLDTRNRETGVTVKKAQGLATAGMEIDAHYNLSRYLHLDLRAGAEAWASRISAERADGSRLFQSPLFNGYVSVGFGVHF